jgi:hypothetical protein
VIVREETLGKIEITAVDSVASMQAVRNPALGEVAGPVRALVHDVIEKL